MSKLAGEGQSETEAAADASDLVDRDQRLLGFQGQLDGNEPTAGVQVVFAQFVEGADVRRPIVALRLHDGINLSDDEVNIAVVDAHFSPRFRLKQTGTIPWASNE